MLAELIDLLTCGDLDQAEVADIVEAIENAPEDPEYEWTEDRAMAMVLELLACVGEYTASSDKLDELHEQIQDLFSEPLPDFPHWPTDGRRTSVVPYFEWLDGELARRAADKGGYDLVEIDDMSSDEMHMIVVYRNDTARILELGNALGMRFRRPLDYWRAIEASIPAP